LPAALSSYNNFPYAKSSGSLCGSRELRAYQNAGRSSFPGSHHLPRSKTPCRNDSRRLRPQEQEDFPVRYLVTAAPLIGSNTVDELVRRA